MLFVSGLILGLMLGIAGTLLIELLTWDKFLNFMNEREIKRNGKSKKE